MIHTLKLKTIAMCWRDIILSSDAIRNYCLDKYGKPPTIFMGVNGKKLPEDKHCPYICIMPGVKNEGLDQDPLTYGIAISWAIVQSDVLVDGELRKWNENLTGEVIEYLGVYESDDFGQLIYETIQAAVMDNHPVTKLEYEVNGASEYIPQWPGHMILQTDIEVAMGEEIEY